MTTNKDPGDIGYKEFISLMALLMSLVALAIDTMLPALSTIGDDLMVAKANDSQLIISCIFLGLAIGQIFYGSLSDAIGRKMAIYIGIGIFIVGCLFSIFAATFSVMLFGRILQGLGVAGPRIVMVALIRDKYEGRQMAQVMSFVMALFILMPVFAPLIGQGIIFLTHWRVIFIVFSVLAIIIFIWFALRQPETLSVEKRIPLSFSNLINTVKEVCSHSTTLGYTMVSGIITGMFLAFLSTSPQILQEQYELGETFPFYFALLALSIGFASFINGRMVMRYGMHLLCHCSLYIFFILSLVFLLPAYGFNGHPPLSLFITYLLLAFFCVGILFGNLNALAMQPLGHIAGVGAAIIGSFSTLLSLPIGIFIGHSYDGTILPLLLGFIACGLLGILLLIYTERMPE